MPSAGGFIVKQVLRLDCKLINMTRKIYAISVVIGKRIVYDFELNDPKL